MVETATACIEPAMTVLDVVSRYRTTETVFKRWDELAGTCICCQALFDTLQQVARRYELDLDRLLADLNAAAAPSSSHRPPGGEERST